LHSSEARGRVGGIVYNTNRGISTCKAKKAPAQPRSALQLKIRAITVSLIQAWAANTHQADWNAWATAHPYVDGMGNMIRASGANWFCGLNTRLALAGLPLVATPPVVPGPLAPATFSLVGTVHTITATFTVVGTNPPFLDIWLTPAHSKGRQGKIEEARHYSYPATTGGTAVVTVGLPGHYTVFVRGFSEVDGQVGLWERYEVDVPAT